MEPNHKKIWILISAAILIPLAIFFFFKKPNPTTLPPTGSFDTPITIPNTTISLSYPESGFYGKGTTVEKTGYTIMVSPTSTYDYKKGSEFVVLRADFVRPLNTGEDLDQFLASSDPQSADAKYMKTGNKEMINGNDFFLYKITEEVTIWNAYMASNGNLIKISLAYKSSDDPESAMAYKNNDQIFRDVLSHVSAAAQ